MKKFFYLSILTILLLSCKHDLENPSWEVDMIVPIAHAELNIYNLIEQDDNNISVQTRNDSLVSLVYSSNILQTHYDSLLDIRSTSEEKIFRIDSVQFDDVIIEHNTTIGSVISQIPFGNTLFPDGSQRDIPAIPGVIQNDSIDVDASEYFQTMTLYSGMMNLEITNGFPTAISNMTLLLYNSINQNLIASYNVSNIESGESYTESISVANQTLDYLMIGLINNIDVEASGGLVPINYTDAISTKISITDIQIMEATAYFPDQLLHQEIVEQSFDVGTARLTELGIKQGSVSIVASSSLPDTVSIIYSIPSLTKNGIPFETLVKIPPNINTIPTTLSFNFDEYIMNLTGKDGRVGGDTVNTIYSEMYIYLDSTGELETIHQVDSFNLLNVFNIVPEYAKGYIGQDTLMLGPEVKNTSVFDDITSGSIDLEEATISLKIENFVGADASISFNQFSTDNTNDNLPLVSATTDNSGNNIINYPYEINRAVLNNTTITPTNCIIGLEASEMIEILPNQTTVAATIILNPNGEQEVEDFLYIEHPISANLNASIPLSFIANNLTFSKTIDTDLYNNSEEEIEELFINLENGLPLSANIDIILLDQYNNYIDTLIENINIHSAITNNNIVISNSNNTISIKNINYNNVRKMKFIASFKSSSITEHVDIYSYYNLKLNLSARFKQIIGE